MAAVSLQGGAVKPLGDRVLIQIEEQEQKTAGGILLPDTVKEKPQVGKVAAVGPGTKTDKGERVAPEVKEGDRVLYSKYAGTEIKIADTSYLLLAEKDILAIVE